MSSRPRRRAAKCPGSVWSPTFRTAVCASLCFFYLVELSVLSKAVTPSGLDASVTLENMGPDESHVSDVIATAARLGFGLSITLFLLLLAVVCLSWYDYQRFESCLLVANSLQFGLSMGFLMSAYELLHTVQANPGLFTCNVLVVLLLPTLDLMDLRPIASLGLEEGFNLMRRAREARELSAFDSVAESGASVRGRGMVRVGVTESVGMSNPPPTQTCRVDLLVSTAPAVDP